MEFLTYKQIPQSITDDLVKKAMAQKRNVAWFRNDFCVERYCANFLDRYLETK
jgi:hypothetical protein